MTRLILVATLAAMLFIGIAIGKTYGRDIIEIDRAAIDVRVSEVERGRGTRLTPAERDQAVNAYIDEHVLARVARRRGFDDDDRIRGILYQKMLQLLAAGGPDPSDDDLRAYYTRNQARYAAAESMTAERWSAGQGGGAVLERVTTTELAFTFGPRVAEQAARAAIGDKVPLTGAGSNGQEWLVIVERHSAGEPPPFESIRHHVRFDWRAEHDETLLKQRIARLRDEFVVRVVSSTPAR